uniref:Ion transport domain-containing protein n=1 Tax=Chromera velia CCMP2878 TaxID=1169474 RepID=A0A0G4F9M3_9ALVE|eukprot:Cvel_2964.t1-p1 / transcript=Cvel_2964.t1 / gene=Cvel_2964 / organism=Chromera_velia_CCMP2878 / gene_product=hypothetical protein / transcript_product=hypothetical protein / location=Cvel_scaffold117:94630-102678(+) / protein_length=632 / sequence_SO=supercontig / SO=protein_coding / is_pseudo=false
MERQRSPAEAESGALLLMRHGSLVSSRRSSKKVSIMEDENILHMVEKLKLEVNQEPPVLCDPSQKSPEFFLENAGSPSESPRKAPEQAADESDNESSAMDRTGSTSSLMNPDRSPKMGSGIRLQFQREVSNTSNSAMDTSLSTLSIDMRGLTFTPDGVDCDDVDPGLGKIRQGLLLAARGRRKVLFFVEELWGNPLQKKTKAQPEAEERDIGRLAKRDSDAAGTAGGRGGGHVRTELKDESEGEYLHASLRQTLLPQIALTRNQLLASHPVVDFISIKKWDLFARRSNTVIQGLTALMVSDFIFSGNPDSRRNVVALGGVWVQGPLVWAVALTLLGLVVWRCSVQIRGQCTADFVGPFRLPFSLCVPFHLSIPMNRIRIAGVVLVLTEAGIELSHGHIGEGQHLETISVKRALNPEAIEATLTGILIWIASSDAFIATKGAQRVMFIISSLAKEFVFFFPILLFVVIGFAQVMTEMEKDRDSEGFGNMASSVITLTAFLCNAWEPDWQYTQTVSQVFFLLFVLLAVIVLTSAVSASFTAVAGSISEEMENLVHLSRLQKSCNLRPGRLERYESEESGEVPWPSESESSKGGNAAANNRLSLNYQVISALVTLDKQRGQVLLGTTKITRIVSL